MSNPFEYIKNERKLKEERELREQTRKLDEEKKRLQQLEQINNTYQTMVIRILTDLRQAAYSLPDDIIKQSNVSSDKLRWSIGRNRGKQNEEYWVSWVDVTLEIDQNFNPKGFLCKRLDLPKEFRESVPSEVHAGLSVESLVESLQILYPPGS